MGMLKNYYEEVNSPLDRRFVLELFDIIKNLKENFLPLYFSTALSSFYISDKKLVLETIFLKKGLLTIDQAE